MDWDYFIEVNYTELNNDSKEELCSQLSNCKPDPEATDEELKNVLVLAQKLLRFRGSQIEDIKNESAAKIETLRQENEELENQATSSKRARKASEARHEAVRLQKENKDLLAELEILKEKHKGKNPMLDTEEDDYRAERDKQKMKKTVELQTEHIAGLLSDLEGAEAENVNLKQHLSNLRDKLADATEALAETAADLTNSQKINAEFKNRYSDSRDEIESLRRQISELVDQRSQLDSQLYQFQQAMESRVKTWKGMMDQKDTEIIELKQQVLFSRPEQYAHLQDTVSAVTQSLAIRDQQVNELTSRLAEATKELEESTEALEKLRNNKGDGESRKLWQQLQRAVNRERSLEARIEEAEKDALLRGEQVTELSTQLQKLEKGEFGLPEALAEARELKRSLAVRDADIARLIKTTNQLQSSLDELSDQNLALREKFGLSADEGVDVSGVKERRANERQRIEILLKQVANLEQEKVSLKLQFRELKKGKLFVEPEEVSSQKESDQVDVKQLIDENESLRKGMHEILESIRTQDATSEVHLESSCLERLLEALDARHVAGWYHPAMRLQAQLHNAQGVAAELREQLRISREQESAWKEQIGSVLERSESFKGNYSETDHLRPRPVRRKVETHARGPFDPEWSQQVRGMADDVKKIIKEVSRTLPLIASSNQEHEEELNNKISDLETSIDEYKQHLENDKDHSVAICAAKCATQRIAERIALRKCHGLAAARKRLSTNLEEKTLEAIEKEAKLGYEIANLKTKELDLKNEIRKLENLLSTCVPQDEFEDSQQELQKTAESLRKLLLEKNTGNEEDKEKVKLKEDVANYELKTASLTEELKKERSSLRILQMQQHYADADQQVLALGQKLGALEVSESTALKKAEHAEKMYHLAKEQVIELENEKREFEQSMLQHLSVSVTELPLSDQKQQPGDSADNFGKIEGLESKLATAKNQIESLQNLLNNRTLEMDELRELNQRLQSSGDLQATLGRLTEDIIALRLGVEKTKWQLEESERTSTRHKNKSERLEQELQKSEKQKTKIIAEIHEKEKHLKQKLASICCRHTACVPISTFEMVSSWLASVREKVDFTQNSYNELKAKLQDAENDLEEIKLENSSAKELSEVLKGESRDLQKQQIQEWHSRNLQLRIRELESSRKAERLDKECEELKCQLLNLKNHSRSLEDERLDLEKKWEQRLMNLELEKCLGDGVLKPVPPESKPVEPQMTVEELDGASDDQENTKVVKKEMHPHKKLVRRGTFTLLQENPDVLKKELAIKDERIAHLEKVIGGQHGDSRAKLALEAMVASLSELVSLKESAVVRARQRLKEANEEQSEITRELRRQMLDLQNSLAKLQGAQLKEQMAPEASPGPTVTRLLTQVHTLEDELRVANHSAAALAGQLRTAASELQRWKDVAEARQSKLQALQDRYEEEMSQAIATKLSSTRIAEKAETEMSEKELTSVNSNPELLKSRQEVENLREMVDHMQEQIKTLQAKMSERRVSLASTPSKSSKELPEPVQKVEKHVVVMQPRFDSSKSASIISKLQTQVKQLQEEVETFKLREQVFLDQSKNKTSEVVSRWEERKRLQGKCTKLKVKLEESEATAKKLKESNQALRTLIERLEREKILLDLQLRRKTKPILVPQRSTPMEVQLSKARTKLAAVEEECASLRRQLEHHKRIADDMPRMRAEFATLRGKHESQREAAVQMQSKIARLEAANLELNLKIDDFNSSGRMDDRGDSSDDGMSKEELQRSVIVLGQHVRRLQEKLRNARTSTHDSSGDSLGGETSQKLQADARRKHALENEVSQLRRERSELCAQLNQKVKILVEVRAALQEASLREVALKSEISSLRRASHK